jgi:hypothetical protein
MREMYGLLHPCEDTAIARTLSAIIRIAELMQEGAESRANLQPEPLDLFSLKSSAR